MPFGVAPGISEFKNFFTGLFREDEKPAPAKPKAKPKPKPKVTTRRQEVQRVARNTINNRLRLPGEDFAASFRSSVGNTFGIAPRIASDRDWETSP